ncbi:MAG: hypothetical protein HYS86_01940 [Candidatus Chisholmbacteria bacterium]|nr:hypothetical protein [Candidatus Chisholmbacteria bacterium]
MKQQLADLIEKVLKSLGFPKVEFSVERPAEEEHGDWATNVALVLEQKTIRAPGAVAMIG